MLTNKNGSQIMTRGCLSDDAARKRSIDLATAVLIVILNVVEISLIIKIKRKKKIYEIILVSLSVSDCMFGLSNVIVSSIYLSNSCKYDGLIETAYVSYAFFVLTSIFHLIFIAVDRVMIVLKPFQYEIIFTTKRLKIGIAVLWIVAFIIGVCTYTVYELTEMEPAVPERLNQSVSQNRTIALITQPKTKGKRERFQDDMQLVLSIIIVTMDVLMVFCYCTIIYQMGGFVRRKNLNTKTAEDARLPILCVGIAAAFIIFTLPYAIARFYLGKIPFWANFILLLNSGMNSVVYFFRQRIEKYHKKENNNYQLNSTVTTIYT